jgi:hypothetical protein
MLYDYHPDFREKPYKGWCDWCQMPFRSKRPDAKTCKDSCRVALHRHNKRKAREQALRDNFE